MTLNWTPTQKQRWALAGVTAVMAAGAVFWPHPDHAEAPPPRTTVLSTTTSTLGQTTVVPTSTIVLGPAVSLAQPTPEKPAPVDLEPARQAVAAFVPAWLTPGTPEERTAALLPSTSPGLLIALADVPAENLPAATLTGVGAATFDGYTAKVPASLSDGSTVVVELVETAAGWRVTDVRPGGA